MSRVAQNERKMKTAMAFNVSSVGLSPQRDNPRMQYRSRPVSVAVDPISLVISECTAITSAVHKHARSSHSSVSAILGGNPNPVFLGPPGPVRTFSSRALDGDIPDEGIPYDRVPNDILHTRWGLRGRNGKTMQGNPTIAGFGKLRHEIAIVKDVHTFDAPSLLAPFLLVIQAKGTAAPITILALGALTKFLAYGFVCPASPRFALAMQSLSAAVTHCQFDISDSAQGEVVLLMILNLMEDMLSGPGGDILSDESVCDMMGRGLAICSQPRFSPVLRRTAEATMVRMCQIIFEDVKHLDVDPSDDVGIQDGLAEHTSAAVRIDSLSDNTTVSRSETDKPDLRESLHTGLEGNGSNRICGGDSTVNDVSDHIEDTDNESIDLKPYSLPSVRELFRVLVNFLDPNDLQHTDTMRVMALRIIHVALEVAGPFIARHPALASIAEDRLCCYLFQLVRSDNMSILQESLVVAVTLLATCREVLKLQQELLLSYLIACLYPTVHIPREPGIDLSIYSGIPETPKLVKPPPSQPNSGRSTPVSVKDRQKLGLEGGARKPDARQVMVESIGVLSRMPTFVTELFVNYDCDEDRADLCEDIIGLLSRNALPDSATWSTTSVPPLCLDALLRYIQFLAERLHDVPVSDDHIDPSLLRERRRRKKIIIKGAAKFNEKPKTGLGYLEAHGIIQDARDPILVAKFLKGTSRVSKAVLGDFLSKRGNEPFLDAFMGMFDFSGKRIDQALRSMLETFRLPGEAPLIASIVESFSEKYCSCNTSAEVANKDAGFILSYAIIILNTDQHNPNLKSAKRMTLPDFSRNLRGQNNGEDFSPDFLKEVFDCIQSNEIILPDEHDNQHAFDYAWRELLGKTESTGNLVLCNTNVYDSDMFCATWRPIVSTLAYVFMSASDDAVFARIVTGFDECARIASKYENVEALDQIIYCLSHITTLATETPYNTALNTEVQAGDGSVMVSELAVKLGRDFRAQLAILVLFRVVTNSESLIRQSWKYIVRIWLNLFVNSLSPSFVSSGVSNLSIPTIPLQGPSQVIDRVVRSNEASFFSAFTSYISSYAADDPPEPSEEELESTLCTVDCINSCDMVTLFRNTAKLPLSSCDILVRTLLDHLPEDENTTVISIKQDNLTNLLSTGQSPSGVPRLYDPAVVFILEFCTILAMRDTESIASLGKQVFDTLQGLLRDSGRWHTIIISRVAFYALAILKASYEHDYVNVPFLLHTISSLPQDVLLKTSDIILAGLAACTDEPGSLRNEVMTSPDFWAILHVLARSSTSSKSVFDILERSTTGNPPAIMADNYEAAVSLLSFFASAASLRLPINSKDLIQHRPEHLIAGPKPDIQAVDRGCRAVDTLYNITARIPQLVQQSHLENNEAWSAYWSPIFEALILQCTNTCRDIRQLAFSAMQRLLLSPELVRSDLTEWEAIFSKVLFPLIHRLLTPEVLSSDQDGISEMQVQSASLLCKVFLQSIVLLSEWEGMLNLLVQIIEVMDRLMKSGQSDSLEEAVRENLKNVVLFMESNGFMVSLRQDADKEKLWNETWDRVDRFLPDLRNDLMSEEYRRGQRENSNPADIREAGTQSGSQLSET